MVAADIAELECTDINNFTLVLRYSAETDPLAHQAHAVQRSSRTLGTIYNSCHIQLSYKPASHWVWEEANAATRRMYKHCTDSILNQDQTPRCLVP